jgi:hypothetical protein
MHTVIASLVLWILLLVSYFSTAFLRLCYGRFGNLILTGCFALTDLGRDMDGWDLGGEVCAFVWFFCTAGWICILEGRKAKIGIA